MNFKLQRLGDIAEIIMGQSPPSQYYNESYNGLPFIQGKTEFGRLYPTFVKFTSKFTKIAEKNDILFTVRAPVGELNLNPEKCCIGRGVASIRANEGDNRFLFYLLLFSKDLFKLKSSGAIYDSINKDNLANTKLKYPILKETRDKISDALSNYDDLIENNLRRIELLERSAELLYKEWFVNLRFPGYEKVEIKNGVPTGWDELTLYDIMTINSGGTPRTNKVEYWDGKIPFYTPKDYNDHFYVLKTEKTITDLGLKNCNSKLYEPNTIFISARGTVGAITMNQKPMSMNQTNYALKGKEGLSQFFLFCVIRNKIKHLKSTASGAVFDAIVVDTFKLIPFVLPNKDVIQRFTEIVSPMFNQIEKLLLINDNLIKARDLLLPKLINGEIEV